MLEPHNLNARKIFFTFELRHISIVRTRFKYFHHASNMHKRNKKSFNDRNCCFRPTNYLFHGSLFTRSMTSFPIDLEKRKGKPVAFERTKERCVISSINYTVLSNKQHFCCMQMSVIQTITVAVSMG